MVLITNDVVRLSKMTLSRTLHAVGVDKGAKLNGWPEVAMSILQTSLRWRRIIHRETRKHFSQPSLLLARSQCLRVAHAQVTQLQSLKRSHG